MAALIPDLRKFIVGQEVKNAASVSEATWRKIGGMVNFLGHRVHLAKAFPINGNYGMLQGQYPINAIDGYQFFEYDAEIFNVWVYSIVKGVSGITELDVKIKPKAAGVFTSIFSTTPKISSISSNETFFEIGDVGTGITAPVLNGGIPYNVNQGDAIRLDLISAMTEAEHCGVVIHFRPR
jgi:hypothetical protein